MNHFWWTVLSWWGIAVVNGFLQVSGYYETHDPTNTNLVLFLIVVISGLITDAVCRWREKMYSDSTTRPARHLRK